MRIIASIYTPYIPDRSGMYAYQIQMAPVSLTPHFSRKAYRMCQTADVSYHMSAGPKFC